MDVKIQRSDPIVMQRSSSHIFVYELYKVNRSPFYFLSDSSKDGKLNIFINTIINKKKQSCITININVTMESEFIFYYISLVFMHICLLYNVRVIVHRSVLSLSFIYLRFISH